MITAKAPLNTKVTVDSFTIPEFVTVAYGSLYAFCDKTAPCSDQSNATKQCIDVVSAPLTQNGYICVCENDHVGDTCETELNDNQKKCRDMCSEFPECRADYDHVSIDTNDAGETGQVSLGTYIDIYLLGNQSVPVYTRTQARDINALLVCWKGANETSYETSYEYPAAGPTAHTPYSVVSFLMPLKAFTTLQLLVALLPLIAFISCFVQAPLRMWELV